MTFIAFLILLLAVLLVAYYFLSREKVAENYLIHEAPLMRSSNLMLLGKPDAILEIRGELAPLEFKSKLRERPLRGHVLQLAAYCALLEEFSGVRVRKGILKYANRKFEIPFDDELRSELGRTLMEMRNLANLPISEAIVFAKLERCEKCSARDRCPAAK